MRGYGQMNNEVIDRVAKAIRDPIDNLDSFEDIAKAAIKALLDLPEGSVIYQDCFEESIKSILGK